LYIYKYYILYLLVGCDTFLSLYQLQSENLSNPTMNRTEGPLSRFSRGRRWNKDVARKKGHFARTSSASRPLQVSNNASCLPNHPSPITIQPHRDAGGKRYEPLGFQPDHIQDEIVLQKLFHGAVKSAPEYLISSDGLYLRGRTKAGDWLLDPPKRNNINISKEELDAKRLKLLQKGDWVGIGIHKEASSESPAKEQRPSQPRNTTTSGPSKQQALIRTDQRINRSFYFQSSPQSLECTNGTLRISIGSHELWQGNEVLSAKNSRLQTRPCNQDSVFETNCAYHQSRSLEQNRRSGHEQAHQQKRPTPSLTGKHIDRSQKTATSEVSSLEHSVFKSIGSDESMTFPLFVESSPAVVQHPKPMRVARPIVLEPPLSSNSQAGESTLAQVGYQRHLPTASETCDDDLWQQWAASLQNINNQELPELRQKGPETLLSISPGISNQQEDRPEALITVSSNRSWCPSSFGYSSTTGEVNTTTQNNEPAQMSNVLAGQSNNKLIISVPAVDPIDICKAASTYAPSSQPGDDFHGGGVHSTANATPSPKFPERIGESFPSPEQEERGLASENPSLLFLSHKIHGRAKHDPAVSNRNLGTTNERQYYQSTNGPIRNQQRLDQSENEDHNWMKFIFSHDGEDVRAEAFEEAKKSALNELWRPVEAHRSLYSDAVSCPSLESQAAAACGSPMLEPSNQAQLNARSKHNSLVAPPSASSEFENEPSVSYEEHHQEDLERSPKISISLSPDTIAVMMTLTGDSGESIVVETATPETDIKSQATFKFSEPKPFIGRLAGCVRDAEIGDGVKPLAPQSPSRDIGKSLKRPKHCIRRRQPNGRVDIRSFPDYAEDPIEE
jgi:hypothetical protein